ncbi:MAG: toprim domain-containing protein, partial [Methanomassiliicoccales archaeon]
MNIDPSTTKYLIKARLNADGIVEKPDVVGAIFGQTEGLLGDELDLRDLQKSGRIGRIEVDVHSKQGKSEGEVLIPSSLDQVETVILASALETIDRAKELLTELIKVSKTTGVDLTESVRQSVQVEEIIYFGKDRLPAGPNVVDSDAVIVVEGRNDVLNLLKSGIKNAIAVEGTNIPKTVSDLSKERVVTAFVDGDRGGELILRELFQVAEVDFVARAPRAHEVEELTQKQIMKCLRNKIPGEQFVEMFGLEADAAQNGKTDRSDKAEKLERFERQEKAERAFADREEKVPEKPERGEKERSERDNRSERSERGERQERGQPREDREQRQEKPQQQEREERPERQEPRQERRERSDRDRSERSERGERQERGQPREDREQRQEKPQQQERAEKPAPAEPSEPREPRARPAKKLSETQEK